MNTQDAVQQSAEAPPQERRILYAENLFRARWQKWEARGKSDQEHEFLLRFLGNWAQDIVSTLNFGQQQLYAREIPLQLGYLLGVAVASNHTLDQFMDAALKYLRSLNVSARNPVFG